MKLFKIALIAVVMHTVEAKRQGRIAEKEMDGNLLPRNDCAEMVDQNKSAESENSEVTSTTSNVSSRTENDITDDALSSQSEESSELQLSMSKNGGRNKSQISVIDAVYLNEAESIALCQKALTCEEKLKWHELTCQRQHVYPNLILEPKTKLSDISVQAEFITNSGVADVMESVSKVCMKPITSDVLRQLSNLHRKIELSRKLCIRHVANNQNLLPIRNKAICEKIDIDEVRNEKKNVDESKFNHLETRQNAFDYCAAVIAPMKKQCASLRECCPNYSRCSELMSQTIASKKYEEILTSTKQIQSSCEKKIVATLQSLHSVFPPFA